jgi:cytidyltransferase-like protein
MKNCIVKSNGNPSSNSNQYSMFVGRWQPLHEGHQWLFNQTLNEGKNVLICIRDVESDDKNPFTPTEVKNNIENFYKEHIISNKVKVMIIPDIESINYGRGVGYDIIEHIPPNNISEISATNIREELKKSGML